MIFEIYDYIIFQINSIFGKTCENPRRYKNLKLIKTGLGAKKQINKAEFASYSIINPNLVVAELKQTTIKLCKPIYTGMVRYFSIYRDIFNFNFIYFLLFY